MILISDFFQNLNLMTISLKSLDLIFIVWCEFLSFMQSSLLVNLFDYLVIFLPVLTLTRSFIKLNTATENKKKSYTIILISFFRSWLHIP